MSDYLNGPCWVRLPAPAQRRLRAAWSVLGLVLLLCGCASAGPRRPAEPAATAKPFVMSVRERVQLHVLAGEMAFQQGRLRQAAEEYGRAVRITRDPKVARRAARLALAVGDAGAAQAAVRRWVMLNPDSLAARQAQVQLGLDGGRERMVLAGARALIRLDPEGAADAFARLAALLSGDSPHQALGVRVMHQLVARHTGLGAAHYALGVVQLGNGLTTQALASARRAIALAPKLNEAYLLEARTLLQMNRRAAADTLMQGRFRSQPHDAGLRLAYGRMLAETGHLAAARRLFAGVLKADPDNADARFAVALLDLGQQELKRARGAFESLYHAGGHRNASAYYLGRIAQEHRHYARALEWYARVQSGAHALDAAFRQAEMTARLGHLAAALRFLEQLRNANPQLAPRFSVAGAQLLFQAGRYAQAVGQYTRALRATPDAPDLLYGRALAEVEAGRPQRAEADLRRVIAQHPKDGRALNALGYILTNHSTRYHDALGYIRRALALMPNNPAVIDSMGWVQYRLGHLHKAEGYLQRAFSALSPPDAQIAAHLGEVLWKLGRPAQARKVWQAGLAASPHSKAIHEAMKRLINE